MIKQKKPKTFPVMVRAVFLVVLIASPLRKWKDAGDQAIGEDASQFIYGTYEGTVAAANTPAP